MKLVLILISILFTPVLTSQFVDEIEACLVQHLKGQGKLSSDFQSVIEPAENCVDRMSTLMESLRSSIENEINKDMSYESNCLLGGMDNRNTIVHFAMIFVLRLNKLMNENDLDIQLKKTRTQLRQDLESIATECKVDDTNFVKLFHKNLGIRNETLDVLEYEYCITKYCVDNQFLELGNYVMNPNNITTDNINCTSIVDIDRKKAEQEFADEHITTTEAEEAKVCIMQLYRTEQQYEWFIALKVLSNEVNARRTKESDVIKATEKLTSTSFKESLYNCMLPIDKIVVTLSGEI